MFFADVLFSKVCLLSFFLLLPSTVLSPTEPIPNHLVHHSEQLKWPVGQGAFAYCIVFFYLLVMRTVSFVMVTQTTRDVFLTLFFLGLGWYGLELLRQGRNRLGKDCFLPFTFCI
jgi:hypothetical protein